MHIECCNQMHNTYVDLLDYFTYVRVVLIVKSPQADISWTKGAKRLMANLDRCVCTCVCTSSV